MRDYLVPVEVEIDPLLRTAPFGAAEQFAIKLARSGETMNRKRQMKRRQDGVGNAHDVRLAGYVGDAVDDPGGNLPDSPLA
jgi:hypothetical protein